MSVDKDRQFDPEFTAKMDAHYAAVGLVASTWAEFEHIIQWAIWNLACLDNLTGACITTQIGNSGRLLDATIALLRLRGASETDVKPILKFAEKVGKKQRQRNRFVHDPWSFKLPDAEPGRFEVSARREVITHTFRHSTKEVTDFAREIMALVTEFDNLLTAVSLPPTSLAKQP